MSKFKNIKPDHRAVYIDTRMPVETSSDLKDGVDLENPEVNGDKEHERLSIGFENLENYFPELERWYEYFYTLNLNRNNLGWTEGSLSNKKRLVDHIDSEWGFKIAEFKNVIHICLEFLDSVIKYESGTDYAEFVAKAKKYLPVFSSMDFILENSDKAAVIEVLGETVKVLKEFKSV